MDFNYAYLFLRYYSICSWTTLYVSSVVLNSYSSLLQVFCFCSRILLKLDNSADAYFCLYSSSILLAYILCIKVYLNSWIRLWFSAIYFWYYLDSACLSCCNFLISMFKFFSFYNNLLIWSWLSNSWAIVNMNLLVCPVLIFSINYSSLAMSILRSPRTFNESLSKSGFSLNSLHNFLVLYFKITDKFAISAYTTSSSLFWVIWVKLALFKTSSANFC